MLTATTTTFQNAITLGITINYPEIAKRKPENMLVASTKHAQRVINNKTRDFVFETILTFVKHRQRCLNAYPHSKEYKSQILTIDRLICELSNHQTSKLEVLAGLVAKSEKHLRAIQPHKTSPFRRKFTNVISPVLQWCKEYSSPAVSKKRAA